MDKFTDFLKSALQFVLAPCNNITNQVYVKGNEKKAIYLNN